MQQSVLIQRISRKGALLYVAVIMACVCCACRRQVQVPSGSSDDARISFIAVSAQMMEDGGGYVLIDNTDSAFPQIRPGTLNQPVLDQEAQFMYPTTPFNETLTVPWIFYMHLYPGRHSFTLVDTGLILRATDEVQLGPNAPVSIYYADSVGYFRSLVLQDQFTTQSSQANIRFLDLSPDAGSIFFTIDDQPASAQGFDTTYAYGQHSGFIPFPNQVSDTLRINFYQAGDSVDVIAREFLQADPGHAYTFILEGYYNTSPSYPDPLTGKTKTPTGGLSILVNKNY
jgi:hypothetical protein